MKCIYLDSPRFLGNSSCKYNCKYGHYCFKHRHIYLLHDDIINFDRFTFNISDYTVINIKNTLRHIYPSKKWNIKKDLLYNELLNHIEITNSKKYNKIQAHIRGYLVRINMIRGIGYFKKDLCMNSEDFYYMTNPYEIENKYFFSYNDTKCTWFFDIRSFKRLIDENHLNPYTRDVIPDNIKEKAYIILSKLESHNIPTSIVEFVNYDYNAVIKQKTVDLCSNMSQCGYHCEIDWFLSLNRHKLKKLYKALEDIWNYRAFLSQDVKSRISPPYGLVFTYSIIEISYINDKNELRSILLNEIEKFNNAISIEDRKLGYMYFLIGLSEVYPQCLQSHEWIQYAIN